MASRWAARSGGVAHNSRALPSFLLIGAQKSGTTTLLDALQGEPAVFAPASEIHYFSHRWDRGIDWYEKQFASHSKSEQVLGEKSPSYLSHPLAAERIATTLPGVRLVAILRDPVERAYSHYWHNRRLDKEPLSFVDALAAEEDRVDAPRTASQFGYVQLGRYDEQLRRYDGLFPPEQLLIVFLEDLMRSAEPTLAQVCRFVGAGAPSVPMATARRSNAYVEYRSHRVRRASRRLPTPLRAAIFRANTRAASYEPMPSHIRAKLEPLFLASDAALSSRVGRKLPWCP